MVENYAEHPETVTIELELGIDGADIFEVRGRVRDRRGTLHPAAVLPARATFRYDGLDGRRRSTHLRFSGPADEIEAGRSASGRIRRRGLGASPLDLAACSRPATRELRWVVWATFTDRRESGRQSGRAVPGSAPDRRGRAAARTTPGRGARPRSTPTTSCSTCTVSRSIADLRLLINDGAGRRRALPRRRRALVHARCSGGTRSSRRSRCVAVPPAARASRR